MSTAPAPRKPLYVIVCILLVMEMIYFIALMFDHLVMENGSYYPAVFAERISVATNVNGDIGSSTPICDGKGVTMEFDKENGHFMRCATILDGTLTWPKTYLIENYDQLTAEPPKG